MHPRTFRFVHSGLAAGAALFCLWATDLPVVHKALALAAGLAVGARTGAITGRALERRVDRGGGVVLYAQDTALSALVWPLLSLVLSPLASATVLLALVRSPEVRRFVQLALCGVTSAWLAHDLAVSRTLRRASHRAGGLHVQWFDARSDVGPEAMIGRTGIVTTACAPQGYVRVGGELWQAQSVDGSALAAGQEVTIRRMDGLLLLVDAPFATPGPRCDDGRHR